jgi:hypothetical protein
MDIAPFRALAVLLLTTCLAGCASLAARGWMEPMEAIRGANAFPSRGIRGDFVMVVRATGANDAHVFLNSERDYRDQRNLTIAIPSVLAPSVADHLGVQDLHALEGRRIVVRGTARRVKIGFFHEDGRPTDKYYFQTQLRVGNPRHVRLAR